MIKTSSEEGMPIGIHDKYQGSYSGSTLQFGFEKGRFEIRLYEYVAKYSESQKFANSVTGLSLNPFTEASVSLMVGNSGDVVGESFGTDVSPPVLFGVGAFKTNTGKSGLSVSGSLSPINLSGIRYDAVTTKGAEVAYHLDFIPSSFEKPWNKAMDFLENAFEHVATNVFSMKEDANK